MNADEIERALALAAKMGLITQKQYAQLIGVFLAVAMRLA